MFWKNKTIGHRCGPSLMFSLSWVVVIDHIIFMTRRLFFWYLWIEVKDWCLILVTSLLFFIYEDVYWVIFCHWSQRHNILLAIWITKQSTYFYMKLIYSPTMSFSHHICCCFIVCNNFSCFIEKNSQLDRFLTWNILNVFNCVQ